jgi:benzoate-CoA ligase
MVHVKKEPGFGIEFPEEMNAATFFIDNNIEAGRGDKVAIYYAGEPPNYFPKNLTYKEVLELVNKTGNALKTLNIGLEDRVLLLLFDSPEFVASFFGAIKIGAVPIPVNTMSKPEELRYMLNDSRAKVLIAHEELVKAVEEIRADLKFLRFIVVVGETKGDQISYEDILKQASAKLDAVMLSKDDFCFWLYSSGTTGPPKGIVHLQHDMLYCADTYFKHVLGINEKDVCYSVSKLFFAYGLGNAMYAPFRFGASSVLYPGRPSPEKAFELIEKYKVTVFFAVPLFYARMLAVKDAEKRYDLSSLRLCVSAGEALPASIYEDWKRRFGIDILDGIGTTEVLHIFISNRVGRIRPGSSGVVVPGYEIRIVDEEGKDVPVGTTGRLLVKGDSIAAFYWNKHEKTKKTFLGEWIDTGDLYYMDEDGYLWHAGRSDDLIKSAGMWVSPVEVEGVLMKHPAVLKCAVVQSYTLEGVGRPKAFVVLKEGYKPSPELENVLKEFVKSQLASFKQPGWIEFVSDLPETATGKIQRFKLRELERQRLLEVKKELKA